jgi:hypothetical protein
MSLSLFRCLISIGSNLIVSKCDKSPNARTMTAVTILANVQYTVFTFGHKPNLDIDKITEKVEYTCQLVSLLAIK